MPTYLLAHDLGTTGDKATLFDAEGRLLASAFAPYPTRYPRPGWAEHDPEDWWNAVCATSRRQHSTSLPDRVRPSRGGDSASGRARRRTRAAAPPHRRGSLCRRSFPGHGREGKWA